MNETQTHGQTHGHHHHGHAAPTDSAGVIDPVCGMSVNPDTSKHNFDHNGKTFRFCCAGCRDEFAANPGKYLHGAEPALPPPAPPGAVWTCPMHPEVQQDHPGSCPICGMTLEPMSAPPEDEENGELRDMTRRLWIAA